MGFFYSIFIYIYFFSFTVSLLDNEKIVIFWWKWGKKSFIFQKCQNIFGYGGLKWVGRGTANIFMDGLNQYFYSLRCIRPLMWNFGQNTENGAELIGRLDISLDFSSLSYHTTAIVALNNYCPSIILNALLIRESQSSHSFIFCIPLWFCFSAYRTALLQPHIKLRGSSAQTD